MKDKNEILSYLRQLRNEKPYLDTEELFVEFYQKYFRSSDEAYADGFTDGRLREIV